MFTDSSLSEQQAAVQEHLQSLNETEYSFVMNKFNVSFFAFFIIQFYDYFVSNISYQQKTFLLVIKKQKNMLEMKEKERRKREGPFSFTNGKKTCCCLNCLRNNYTP